MDEKKKPTVKKIPLGLNGKKVSLIACPECHSVEDVGQITLLNHGGTTSYFCSKCFVEFMVRKNKITRVYKIKENGEVKKILK